MIAADHARYHALRCPRCFRAEMVRDDGTVKPHRRPSKPHTKLVWVWCGVRAKATPTPHVIDGGRSA